MEDVHSLVASTLDAVTQQDRTFIAGASQALADWTAKYQHAMSQGKNQSMQDQLARWDEVREAGIVLSRHITTLTTEHGVRRDIPDPYTGLLPTNSGPDRGHFLRSERHSSLFTVQVRGSGPGQANNGLYFHLPV